MEGNYQAGSRYEELDEGKTLTRLLLFKLVDEAPFFFLYANKQYESDEIMTDVVSTRPLIQCDGPLASMTSQVAIRESRIADYAIYNDVISFFVLLHQTITEVLTSQHFDFMNINQIHMLI